MRQLKMRPRRPKRAARTGVAALDYVLLLGVVLPMAMFGFAVGLGRPGRPGILMIVYEMICGLIAWPFL